MLMNSAVAEPGSGRYMSRACRLFLPWMLLLVAAPGCLGQATQPGDVFLMGSHPKLLLAIDSRRDEIVAQIPTKGRAPKEVVPSPDGTHVYLTTDARQQIEVVNFSTQKVEDVIDLAAPGTRLMIMGLAVNHKGDRLYAQVKQTKLLPDEFRVLPPEIWSIDLRTHQKQKILTVPEGIVSLLVPADENRLIAWGRDLYFIDLAQRRITDTVPLMTRSTPSAGPVDTLPVFLQYEQSGILSMPYYTHDPITNKELMGLANLNVDTGKLDLMELGTPIPLYSTVISPDHKRAYSVMNQLVAVDLEKKKIIGVQDLKRTTYVINISRDGKKLYLPSAGSFLTVYDAESLKLIKQMDLPGDPGVTQFRNAPGAP
jgi:DNA-binding beta-propeller fold protein YncE